MTTKMNFCNKINNIMIVSSVKELFNRADHEILFTDIMQSGTFH